MNESKYQRKLLSGFNPLNQVYVFNWFMVLIKNKFTLSSFNPLNQVYVFNTSIRVNKHMCITKYVLIP